MSTPKRWFVLSVRTREEGSPAHELLPEAVGRAGGNGAVEDGEGGLLTYFPDPEDPELLLEEVRRELEAYTGTSALDLSWRWQEHEAWADAWREGFKPRRVTDRLVVAPSWTEPEVRAGDLVLTLDPGMAFGTAEHPTTRGCLRLLDRTVEEGSRWADLGAGSGILAIAAVRLGARAVTAVESDLLACTTAHENLQRNAVEEAVEILGEEVTPGLLDRLGPFDGIVANIEWGILMPLVPALRGALVPEGRLILSGILDHEAPSVQEDAGAADLELIDEDREETWWSGLFIAKG